jgi:hypothetical protein
MWQTEITKYLASQHPYLELENITINFKRLDAVKGAAVGTVAIPEKEISIPIIIGRPGPGADPELHPMDVFLHEGKAHHLNPRSLQQLAHDPQIGVPAPLSSAQGGPRSIGSNPYIGDMTGDASPLEYSGQSSPFAGPFDAFSVKAAELRETGSLVEDMAKLGYLHPNDLTNFRRMLATNPQMLQGSSNNLNLIELLMRYKKPAALPSTPDVVRPNVVQVHRDPMTGELFYMFSGGAATKTTKAELRTILGDKYNDAMAKVNAVGSYIIAEEVNQATWEPTKTMGSEARPITGDGIYMVRGKGNDSYHGFVAQKVMRLNGESLPVKLFVSRDGRYALSGELFGVKLTRKNRMPASTPTSGSTGCFVSYVHGTPIATVPLRINRIVRVPTDDENKMLTIYNVTDPVTGENLSAIPHEGVLGFQRMLDIEPTAMSQTRGDIYYIPSEVDWVKITQPIEIAADSSQLSKIASELEKESITHIVHNGSGYRINAEFGFDKESSFDLNNLDRLHAREILFSMGMDHDSCEEVLDFSRKHRGEDGGIKVAGLHGNESRGYEVLEKKARVFSQETIDFIGSMVADEGLTKAAAEVGGETLDEILSLNFVYPSNVRFFTDNVDKFEEVVSDLAGLLVSIRLGLKHVHEQPVKESMEGLSRVATQLRILKSAMDHKKEKA